MRTIKFRAWVKVSLKGKMEMLDWDTYSRPIGEWLGNNSVGAIFMQFTGLLDKNGKEIYEGDLVTFGAWQPGKWKIGWNEDCARFDLFWVGGGEEGCMNLCYDDDEKVDLDLTVVGNIYDNPELLGKT